MQFYYEFVRYIQNSLLNIKLVVQICCQKNKYSYIFGYNLVIDIIIVYVAN